MGLERPVEPARPGHARSSSRPSRRLPADRPPADRALSLRRRPSPRSRRASRPRALDDESRLRDALERLPAAVRRATCRSASSSSPTAGPRSPAGFEGRREGTSSSACRSTSCPSATRRSRATSRSATWSSPATPPRGRKIPVKVLVRSRGFEGRRAEVAIRPADRPRRPAARDPADDPRSTASSRPSWSSRPTAPGRRWWPRSAPAGRGGRREQPRPVPGRLGDRKLRVIYMEGSPDPEYAFIRDALVEDPDIECVAMSVDFQSNFQPSAPPGRRPLQGLPDHPRGAARLRRGHLQRHRPGRLHARAARLDGELVGEARRRLRDDRRPHQLRLGRLGPDHLGRDDPDRHERRRAGPGLGSSTTAAFRVVVPPEVETHPIWRIVDDPAKNREILDRMPPFHGTNLTDRLKPAATLLGVSDRPLAGHNCGPPAGRLQPRPGRPTAPTGTPIFSAQPSARAGRSRCRPTRPSPGAPTSSGPGARGTTATSASSGGTSSAGSPRTRPASSRRLEVATDKVIYRPGERFRVTARAFDEHLDPTRRYRLVARLRGVDEARRGRRPACPPSPTPLSPRPNQGDYEGDYVPSPDDLVHPRDAIDAALRRRPPSG